MPTTLETNLVALDARLLALVAPDRPELAASTAFPATPPSCSLQGSGVRFLVSDMPEANDLIVGLMAPVAHAERQAISRRTRQALAAARAGGTRLGNPNGAEALRRAGKGTAPLHAAVRANADAFARSLAPLVAELQAQGATTLRALAAALNARYIRTRRGGQWHVSNVRNLLARLETQTKLLPG